jgi:hypothetical protein
VLGLLGGCGEPSAPPGASGDRERAIEAIEADMEEGLTKRAQAQHYFEMCAMDEPSYRAIRGLASGTEGEPPSAPEPCRQFWALKRDFRLEHDCLQPTKPAQCEEYFARKRSLGL